MIKFLNLLKSIFSFRKYNKKFNVDPRNDDYILTSANKTIHSKRWSSPYILNQGSSYKCVAYSLTMQLMMEPNLILKGITRKEATKFINDLYKRIQQNDRKPGEAYEGTWIEDGLKLLVKEGYYKSFMWAIDKDTVLDILSSMGPLVCRIYMGWIKSVSKIDGSAKVDMANRQYPHAIIMDEVDVVNQRVWFLNSYGYKYGYEGRFSITFNELNKMMDNGLVTSIPLV